MLEHLAGRAFPNIVFIFSHIFGLSNCHTFLFEYLRFYVALFLSCQFFFSFSLLATSKSCRHKRFFSWQEISQSRFARLGEIRPKKTRLRKRVKNLGEETNRVVFEAENQLKCIALDLRRLKTVHLHVVHPNEIKWLSQSGGRLNRVGQNCL